MIDFSLYTLEYFIVIGIIIVLIQSDFYLTLKGYSLYKRYYSYYLMSDVQKYEESGIVYFQVWIQIYRQPPIVNAVYIYNHSSLTDSFLSLRSENEIWVPPSFEAKESGLLYVEQDDT